MNAIERFVDAATRFCIWAEGNSDESVSDLIIAQKHLSELHAAALNLPDIEPKTEQISDLLDENTLMAVRDRFSTFPFNGYWSVFDPIAEPSEAPVYNLLSDDLLDIYRDVKESVLLYQQGETVDAIWQWRFDFQTHWGHHLLSAQYAIHNYLSNY
jgi:hypothetical protein